MTTDTVGGVWTYCLELAGALAELGVEVHFATMGEPVNRQQRSEAMWLSNVTLHESRYRLEWMNDPWDDLNRAGEWLLSLEEEIEPDVVHLNGYVHGNLPWSSPTLMVGHSCVFSWHTAVRNTFPSPEWASYYIAVKAGISAADRVTAPTRAMLSELNRYYGPFKETEPIYNGRLQDAYGCSRKESIILTAGRLWDEAKNMSVLEEIASDLSWPIYAAGPKDSPAGGEVTLRNLLFLGHLSSARLARWYGQAAVFALPARYEPFGLTALEAGLSGCALVLGNIPSLRELWSGAALFVPPDQPEAVAETLRALIRNPGLRMELGRKARQRALWFTPKRMADRYLTQYRNLVRSCQTKIIHHPTAVMEAG
ncbi:MAG: glycosyltransferase family 4 protein [Thermodesulfobacteriota bacterium]